MEEAHSLLRCLGSKKDRQMARDALELAAYVHKRHARDNGDPYILHPVRAALILAREMGISDAGLACAALLHDVPEMSRISSRSLEKRFGKRVAGIVRLVTKPRRRIPGWEDRYYARIKRAGNGADLVKFADRLDNMRDLKNAPKAKQRRYLRATIRRFVPWMREADQRFYKKLSAEIARYGRLKDS